MLPIEHATQIGEVNACGDACMTMIANLYRPSMRKTVRQMHVLGGSNTGFTSFGEIIRLLNDKFEIPAYTKSNADFTWHRQQIETRHPTIALVDYRHFKINPPPTLRDEYDLAHFVVVVGFDDHFVYIHDPLYLYGVQRITHEEFNNAITSQSEYPRYDAVTKKRIFPNGKNLSKLAVGFKISYSKGMALRAELRKIIEGMTI